MTRKRKREPVSGQYARRAVMDALALVTRVQLDLVIVAFYAGSGDVEALERAIKEVMKKLQQIATLLRGALTGNYEQISDSDEEEEV